LTRTDLETAIEEAARAAWKAPEVHLQVLAERGQTIAPDVIAIPLLKDAAAAGSPRMIDESEIDDLLFMRPSRAPHPGKTVAIRVVGSSMEPSLRDGFIVALDMQQQNPAELANAMVAARDPSGAVTVKYLRRVQDEFLLVSEHTSTDYNPILLSREPGWSIIGKVLWWIGEPKK